MKGIVYRARSRIDGSTYIGMSTNSLEERREQHLMVCRQPFHRALASQGPENWDWDVVEEIDGSIDQLRAAEKEHVKNARASGKCLNYDRAEWARQIAQKNRGKKNPHLKPTPVMDQVRSILRDPSKKALFIEMWNSMESYEAIRVEMEVDRVSVVTRTACKIRDIGVELKSARAGRQSLRKKES